MTTLLKLAMLAMLGATTQQIVDSGRAMTVGETPDARVSPARQIAPGAPPLLSFRYYEGKKHQRFNNTDLMLDDAGH
jgi:hypothetical protein